MLLIVGVTHQVLKSAHAHEAFKFATDSRKIVVLVTDYFMRWGESTASDLMMTDDDERVLLSICEEIQQASMLSRRPSRIVKLRLLVPNEIFGAALPRTSEIAKRLSVSSDSGVGDMSGAADDIVPESLSPKEMTAAERQVSFSSKQTA